MQKLFRQVSGLKTPFNRHVLQCFLFATGFLILAPGYACAGPPFVTDDPEPTDLGHWEVYNFAMATQIPGLTTGQAGLDINYGGAKNLQLTAVIPMNYQSPGRTGLGDIELAAKYKFLHQSDGSLTPDLSFFPRLFTPTAGHPLGTGRLSLFLPVWGQKDFGPWSVFGGGGYFINPGPAQRNDWQYGLAVSRGLSSRLTLGVEVYGQTRAGQDAPPYLAANLGALYKLWDHWSLIGAAGAGLQHARQNGQCNLYVALEAEY